LGEVRVFLKQTSRSLEHNLF